MDFWTKVQKCKHEATANYAEHIRCGHEDLGCAGGTEWHCKHCGVYVTDDPCGYTAGMSGWPHRRWKANQKIWSSKVQWGAA